MWSSELPPVGARPGPLVWDLTRPGSFTAGAEGPATDVAGNVYAVNLAREGTIGRLTSAGQLELFADLPTGHVGNGIRCSTSGDTLYVADYVGHTILRVDIASRAVSIYARNRSLHQPNDLAIGDGDVLYASDPDWAAGTGRIWRVGTDRQFVLLDDGMGTTNGIELSPDGTVLYVNESLQRRIWAYDLDRDGELVGKWLVTELDDFGLDGMRFGPDGLLYVARYGKGTIACLQPDGLLLSEVRVRGAACTNLTFAGQDGGVCVVTSADRGNLQAFGLMM